MTAFHKIFRAQRGLGNDQVWRFQTIFLLILASELFPPRIKVRSPESCGGGRGDGCGEPRAAPSPAAPSGPARGPRLATPTLAAAAPRGAVPPPSGRGPARGSQAALPGTPPRTAVSLAPLEAEAGEFQASLRHIVRLDPAARSPGWARGGPGGRRPQARGFHPPNAENGKGRHPVLTRTAGETSSLRVPGTSLGPQHRSQKAGARSP